MTVNEILKIYLGADEKGGYQPVGSGADRLKRASPSEWEKQLRHITPYLDFDHTPDWSTQNLSQASDAFAERISEQFPELDEIAVRSLANRFSYNWR